MVEKIDVHNIESAFSTARKRLSEDDLIIPKNKELITSFLRDCTLGKTVKKKQKKKIGAGRCHKYLTYLKLCSGWFKKPFDEVQQKDMEDFIEKLEGNGIRKKDGKPYSDESKADIKKILKKFYKWLLGENIRYPELVDWFDTNVKVKEIPALSREEVEKIVDRVSNIRDKAIIMMLFDSGARAEEFLNLTFDDLKEKDDYYMIRIKYSKTKPRTISVSLCTKIIKEWVKEHEGSKNPDSPLFYVKNNDKIKPLSYPSLCKIVKTNALRVLKKNATPHLLRHSSATFYCHKLNRYQLCYRYGWAMSSDMPDRYIDREGLYEEETAEKVKVDEISGMKKENKELNEKLSMMQEQTERDMKLMKETMSHLLVKAYKDNPSMAEEMARKAGLKLVKIKARA